MSYVLKKGLLVPKREVLRKTAHIRVPRANIILRRVHWPIAPPITDAVAIDSLATGQIDTGTTGTALTVSGVVGLNIAANSLLIGFAAFAQDGGGTVNPGTVTATWAGSSMTGVSNLSTTGANNVILYVFAIYNGTTGNQTLAFSWTNTGPDVVASGFSFTGTATTVALAIPSVNIQTIQQSCTTLCPNSPTSVTAMNGDAGVLINGCTTQNYSGAAHGIFAVGISGAGSYNASSCYALAIGNPSPTMQMNGGGAGADPQAIIAFRISSAANSGLQPGGATIQPIARKIKGSIRGGMSGVSPWRGGPPIPIAAANQPVVPDSAGQTIFRVRNQPWKW